MAYFYGAPGTQFSNIAGEEEGERADLADTLATLALSRMSTASAAGGSVGGAAAAASAPSWASIAASGVPDFGAAVFAPPFIPAAEPWEPESIAAAPSVGLAAAAGGVDDRPLCTFFAAGRCRYGDSCRFRHSDASESAIVFFVAAMKRASEDAAAAAAAARAAGSFVGAEASDAAGAAVAFAPAASAAEDADFAAASAQWQANALAAKDSLIAAALETGVVASEEAGETALQLAERRLSAELPCGICMEPVAETASRRFGLLTGCAHAFCLDCIRKWRARIDLPTATVRACPSCRVVSYTVIPSDRFVSDALRKAGISAAYHRQQGRIPCRFFDGGKGECPFGSSCWYAHVRADGTVHTYAKPALRLNADGPTGPSRLFKLSEFL